MHGPFSKILGGARAPLPLPPRIDAPVYNNFPPRNSRARLKLSRKHSENVHISVVCKYSTFTPCFRRTIECRPLLMDGP